MLLPISKPLPWSAAREVLASKNLLPTTLKSAELEQIGGAALRDSFFSAQVTKTGFLQRAFNAVAQIIDPTLTGQKPGSYMDRARAREMLKDTLKGMGYDPAAEGVTPGSLQDLSSDGRLNLIVDTNAEMMANQARAVADNDPDILDAFPCQEFLRVANFDVEARGTARDWPARWRSAGGKFYGGRMIARKDSDVWTHPALNRFGNPWPPFDFNSGMGVRDIGRGEAVKLGVIPRAAPAPRPQPVAKLMGAAPEASVGNVAPPLREALVSSLGDAARIIDGVLTVVRALQ